MSCIHIQNELSHAFPGLHIKCLLLASYIISWRGCKVHTAEVNNSELERLRGLHLGIINILSFMKCLFNQELLWGDRKKNMMKNKHAFLTNRESILKSPTPLARPGPQAVTYGQL
jgi:hypothetical protein